MGRANAAGVSFIFCHLLPSMTNPWSDLLSLEVPHVVASMGIHISLPHLIPRMEHILNHEKQYWSELLRDLIYPSASRQLNQCDF